MRARKANQKRTTKLKSRALSSFPAPGGRSSTVPNPQGLPLVVQIDLEEARPARPVRPQSDAFRRGGCGYGHAFDAKSGSWFPNTRTGGGVNLPAFRNPHGMYRYS